MWLKVLITLLLVQYLNAKCNVCQRGIVACHSENTYSICQDGKPTYDVIPCPTNYVCTGEKLICYPNAAAICNTDPTTTTIEPTTTTTLAEDNNPDAFCAKMGEGGNFKNENDPTCKSFINCFQQNGPWLGNIVYCKNKKPFFYETGCQSEQPEGCI